MMETWLAVRRDRQRLGSVFVIPPYEVHTGEPATQIGLG